MVPGPDLDDYLELFSRYGEKVKTLYLEPEDERYRLLFEQVCRLLMKTSRFNAGLPPQFRQTARNYVEGEERTVAHMRQPDRQHFMLSDIYDFVELQRLQRDMPRRQG